MPRIALACFEEQPNASWIAGGIPRLRGRAVTGFLSSATGFSFNALSLLVTTISPRISQARANCGLVPLRVNGKIATRRASGAD